MSGPEGEPKAGQGPKKSRPTKPLRPPPQPGAARARAIFWSVAAAVFLMFGLGGWLILTPAVRARNVVQLRMAGKLSSHDDAIARLGGRAPAAGALRAYLWLPGRPTEERRFAVDLLGACGRPAQPALLAALSSGDPSVRTAAAGQLGREEFADRRVLLALVGRLRDGHPEVRSVTINVLARAAGWHTRAGGDRADALETVVPEIRKLLDERDRDLRLTAVAALANLPGRVDLKMPPLVRALGDAEPDVRARAASALGGCGARAAPAAANLAGLLNDPAPSVRVAAAGALAGLGPAGRPHAGALLPLLDDVYLDVRRAAFNSFLGLERSAERRRGASVRALQDIYSEQRVAACEALKGLRRAAAPAAGELVKAADDLDPKVRIAALQALGAVGPPRREFLPALVRASKDQDNSVASAAQEALGGRVGAGDAAQVMELLAAKTAEERASAVRALGLFGPSAAAAESALIKLLAEDRSAAVRAAAAWALRSIAARPETAVPALARAAADDPWTTVRRAALGALCALGPDAAPATGALVGALEDRDGEACGSAARALGNIGRDDPAALAPLGRKLADFRAAPEVRRAAAAALAETRGDIRPFLNVLAGALDGEDQEVARIAASALQRLARKEPAAVAALGRKLADAEAPVEVRRTAAGALAGCVGARLIPVAAELVKAVEDPDQEIHGQVIGALGRLGPADPAVVPALVKALGDGSADNRVLAAGALGALRPPPAAAVAPLAALANGGEDKNLRRAAVYALGGLAVEPETVIPLLIGLLADEDSDLRQAARNALLRFGPRAAPPVRAALGDPSDRTRLEAIYVLRSLPRPAGPETLAALAGAARDGSAEVRQAAVSALDGVREAPEIRGPALAAALADADGDVRRQACYAVANLKPPPAGALPALGRLLEDEHAEVAGSAAWALAQVTRDTPEAAGAAAALTRLLEHRNRRIRSGAAGALAELGPAAAGAVGPLLRGLEDAAEGEEYDVRSQAGYALGRLGAPAAEALARRLAAPDPAPPERKNAPPQPGPPLRARLAEILERMGPQGRCAEPALRAAREGPDFQTQLAAARALWKVTGRPEEAVPWLVRAVAMADGDQNARRNAITAFGGMEQLPPEALAALVEALSDPEVRVHAAVALGRPERREDAAAVPALVELLVAEAGDHDGNGVANTAAEALERIGKPAIPALLAAARDADPAARALALGTLGRIGPESREAAEALIAALADRNSAIRCAAAQALARDDALYRPALPALVKLLSRERGDDVPAAACGAIAELVVGCRWSVVGDAEKQKLTAEDQNQAFLALVRVVERGGPEMQCAAARALERVAFSLPPAADRLPPAVVSSLLGALDSPVANVREAAAAALGLVVARQLSAPGAADTQAVVSALVTLLADPEPSVRLGAAAALGEIGEGAGGACEALSRLARSEDPDERSAACRALAALGRRAAAALPALRERLADEVPECRVLAAWAVCAAAGETREGLPVALAAARDEDHGERRRAVDVLGRIGGAPGQAPVELVQALRRELADSVTRDTAAEALGRLGAAALPAAEELLEAVRKDEGARRNAAWALGRIPGAEKAAAAAAELVAAGLKSPKRDGRRFAAETLGLMGPAAKGALPALRERLADDHWDVRRAAANALRAIENPGAADLSRPAMPRLAPPNVYAEDWIRLHDGGRQRRRGSGQWRSWSGGGFQRWAEDEIIEDR